MSFKLANPIIAALDVDSAERCLKLAQLLKGRVGAFKVGPRLVVRYGADLVGRLAEIGPVFIDNKYLDIPSTMEAAVRASFEAGASLVTVHAWAGPEALKTLAKVEADLNRQRPFRILVVTVLTSFSQQNLPPGFAGNIGEQVQLLARMSDMAGLQGFVCSPFEVASLKAKHPAAFLVVPGVRMPDEDKGDQIRVKSPAEALAEGATALVIGRPIITAIDPLQAVEKITASLKVIL